VTAFAAARPFGAPPKPVWPPVNGREPFAQPLFPPPTGDQPPAPRASCWTMDAFQSLVLPVTPPNKPDLDFHRGNFAGMRTPEGLPGLPGGPKEVIFTWYLYLYDQMYAGQGYFEKWLAAYVACGYTHIDFQRAAWMGKIDGVPGCSMEAALDSVRKAKAAGLFVIVNLAIDDGPQDRAEMEPWIRALVAAGMDIGNLAWQADQRMTPGELWEYIQWAAPLLHSLGVKVGCHWMTDSCSLSQAADDPREPRCPIVGWREWHAATANDIDYHYFQITTEGPIFDARPRTGGIIVAVAEVMSALTRQKLVFTEYDTQAEFNDPANRPEVYGDQKGYLVLICTDCSGCLGGLRGPSGRIF
jgi:hypothetical protein